MAQARAELERSQHELTVARARLAVSIAYAAGLDQFIATQREEATRKAAEFARSTAAPPKG